MDLSKLGEFGLIDIISGRFQAPEGVTGIGDDCAIMPQASGRDTLVSTDMLVEGTHFLMDDISAFRLGWKSAAVNISDIAAMGGKPTATFLSLGLPKGLSAEWMEEFIDGYKAISDRFGCPLLGGDTTSSRDKLCISVTVLGEAPSGHTHRRCDAQVGDLICVTGTLGDSGGGLQVILQGKERGAAEEALIKRHYEPMPRVEEGLALSEAHAMMDISDGIGSDLRHILKASGVGAVVDLRLLPLSAELRDACARHGWDAYEIATGGGEDYELLFTIGPEKEKSLEVPHTVIGRITKEKGLRWEGSSKDYDGYKHF